MALVFEIQDPLYTIMSVSIPAVVDPSEVVVTPPEASLESLSAATDPVVTECLKV